MSNIQIFCASLGCDKNLVDTEKMLGLLGKEGYRFTDDESQADVILVNTCCFIGDAKEESVNTILEMASWKEEGSAKALIVTGCLAQRYKEEILKEIPEVDAVLGTTSWEDIVPVVKGLMEEKKETHVTCFHSLEELSGTGKPRILTTGGYYAHLKIAEGCDKRCTYCIIPYLRGSFRSVPMDTARAREAGGAGRTGGEGADSGGPGDHALREGSLRRENPAEAAARAGRRCPGIQWIRLQYCYPEEITDELIEAIRTEEKVCHYLDIPIQHASDSILKRMGRRTNQAQLRRMVEKLRERIPDIALRTTLISGFPG